MSLAIVHHASSINGSAIPGTFNPGFTPTAGNLILVFLHCNIAVSSVTVNTTSWTQDLDVNTGGGSPAQLGMTLWRYAQVGDTSTFPALWTAGSSYTAWEIYEISGVSGTWATDHENSTSAFASAGTPTTTLSCSHTTSNANDLCISGAGQYNGSHNPTWNSGWTSDETSNNNANYGSQSSANQVVAASSAITSTVTYGGSSQPADLMFVTLKTPVPVAYTLTSTQGSYSLVGKSAGRGQKVVFIKSGTTWAVPSDFSPTNTFEALGAGGNGGNGVANTSSGASGGSATYSSVSNISLTPGSTIVVQIGVGGGGNAVGNDTFAKNNAGTAFIDATSGGNASGVTSGGAPNNVRPIGTTINLGVSGLAGIAAATRGGRGGAGSAGPTGVGIQSGSPGAQPSGSGGSGANGGTAGAVGTATVGGLGGNADSVGSGGGAGATSSADAVAGSNGGGGGGGCVTGAHTNGANGGQQSIWTQTSNGETAGPGGGGGGGGAATTAGNGGNAGGYGGAGAGGGNSTTTGGTGGTGSNGIIVVTYTPVANVSLTSAQGTYTLTGKTVSFPRSRLMASAQGSYSLVGKAAVLGKGRSLTAARGFYHLAGKSVNRNHTRKLHANPGHLHIRRQKVILRATNGFDVIIWPVDTGEYDLTGVDAIFGHEIFKLTFSEFIDTSFQDWVSISGADYDSYLNTMYVVDQDAMTYSQTPYLYVFLADGQSQDDTSLLLRMARDWAETGNSPETGEALQVYKYRNGLLMAVSKNRFRGKGKVYQLQFTSEASKDFQLRGWAVWTDKNPMP